MPFGGRTMDFLRREDGAVALIFGLMAIPFMALVGWSVDYVRLNHVHDYLQAQVDTAALNALQPDEQWEVNARHPDEPWKAAMRGEIEREYQGDWARNIDIAGNWVGEGYFRVTANADVPLSFIKLIPGIPDLQLVAVSATAELIKPVEIREPPVNTTLDPEAGDYNRIWMYCYWPDRPANDPSQPKRTHMTPIADNGGSVYTADMTYSDPALLADYNSGNMGLRENGVWERRADSGQSRQYVYFMPQCPSGSFMSFRLENVRFARGDSNYWDSNEQGTNAPPNSGGDKKTGRFNYYTDTYFEEGSDVERYAGLHGPEPYVAPGQKVDILETILCDTEEQCDPTHRDSIIPNRQTNRNPQKAAGGCEPGKYMYYGWEDRPPGLSGSSNDWQHIAWTDRDYDDIRIVIKCPVFTIEGDRHTRLVR